MLPEVLDESKWYGEKHTFTDREGQFIFVYVALPGSRGLSFNSSLVNPKEFKSYWDLTQPKWKGKNRVSAAHRNRTQCSLAVLLL